MDILLMDKLMIQQIVELINEIMGTNMSGVLAITENEISKLLRDRDFMYRMVDETLVDEQGMRTRRFAQVSKVFNSQKFESDEIQGEDKARSLSLALLDLLFTLRREWKFAYGQWNDFVGIVEPPATINREAFFRAEVVAETA